MSDWETLADLAIEQCARTMPEFTTDEVWGVLDELAAGETGVESTPPGNPKMIGNRISAAVRAGWIVDSMRQRPTERKQANGRKITVWASLIARDVHPLITPVVGARELLERCQRASDDPGVKGELERALSRLDATLDLLRRKP